MAEADRELEDVEDWEKIPLETEDFSKMEELEQVNGISAVEHVAHYKYWDFGKRTEIEIPRFELIQLENPLHSAAVLLKDIWEKRRFSPGFKASGQTQS